MPINLGKLIRKGEVGIASIEVLQNSITHNYTKFPLYKITFTVEICKPNIGYLNPCC